MPASSRKLATVLASRIASVVPAGFVVVSRDRDVCISRDSSLAGGFGGANIVESKDSRSDDEKIEAAILSVLGGIQDYISEELTVPWPALRGGGMALPHVRREAQHVNLYYGDDSTPAISIAPIQVAEYSEDD